MTECIDREAMLEQIARREPLMVGDKMISIDALRAFIMNRPVADVDAVPVIRCKDCSYCRELRCNDPYEKRYIEGCLWCMNISEGVMPDDYCSSAKRKENINGN